MEIKKYFLVSVKALILMTVLTGIVYPLGITLLSTIFFSYEAGGSLIYLNGKIIGSELISQKFESDKYFWSRPSAIDYSPLPSGASNLGPTSEQLRKRFSETKIAFSRKNGLADSVEVPVEMAFQSASGVDPHISPEAAFLQIERIAKARNFDQQQKLKLITLVKEIIEAPQFGFLGETRVNVLKLNIALDAMHE